MWRWVGIALLCAAPAIAQTVPEVIRDTITDHADVLSVSDEDALHQTLRDLRLSTGVELAVLTLFSQASHAPETSVETFATDVFNAWGIGDATRNDGILVMLLVEDRAIRIELGEAYGRDWNRVAANIIDRSFLPAFEAGDYRGGILTGVDDVIRSIAIPFTSGETAPAAETSLVSWIALIVFGGATLLVFRPRLARVATRMRRCPNCGRRGLSAETVTHRAATRTGEGEGERLILCSQCTYRNGNRFPIKPHVMTSSRGGFGGGRSGGGGATGRW